MSTKFKPNLDFNVALNGATLKIIGKGERKAFSNTAKSKTDAETYPVYVRVKLVKDPSGANEDAELQIKLRNADNVEIGQEIEISEGKVRINGGKLTFWANQSTYHGREWIFINASAKGDKFDAWN